MDKVNVIKMFIFEQKKKFLLGIILLLILTISIIGFLSINKKNKQEEKIVFENVLEEKNELNVLEEETVEYYYIDIKGQVNVPGVYSIEKGKRVVDAINQAGGLNANADTSLLNLSMMLKDQMVIIVYSKSEIKALENTWKKEIEKNAICKEVVVNDACIVNSKETTVVPNIEENKDSSESANIKESDLGSEKININTASKELLMTLSKIGESKAQSIISYREEKGSFKTIEEIKNVSGIGDALFESIKNYITV